MRVLDHPDTSWPYIKWRTQPTHVGHVQNLPNVLTSWNFSEIVTKMASNHVTYA